MSACKHYEITDYAALGPDNVVWWSTRSKQKVRTWKRLQEFTGKSKATLRKEGFRLIRMEGATL